MERTIKSVLNTFIFLIAVIISMSAAAQADSTTVQQRTFQPRTLQRYYDDRDFSYEQKAAPKGDSILEWLWYQFYRIWSKAVNPKAWSVTQDIIIYTIIAAAIVLIVLNVMGIEVRRFFVRDAQTILAPAIGMENIREMNMDDFIREAASRREWRLAVRYQYLKALRMMTDRELIRWRVGKTNMDYYYELNTDDLKEQFLAATDDFENAWYGNATVDEQMYIGSKKSLEEFYERIKNHIG